MESKDYYRHSRSLGDFRAMDCIALAREAARLDSEASACKVSPPALAFREVMPDGSAPVSLTFGIKVY